MPYTQCPFFQGMMPPLTKKWLVFELKRFGSKVFVCVCVFFFFLRG